MSTNRSARRVLQIAVAGVLALAVIEASAQVIPPTSALGQVEPGVQRILLSPLEADSSIHRGAWKIGGLSASPASAEIIPRFGGTAITLAGIAESGGAKGDFGIGGSIPGQARMVGVWVHLTPTSNVNEVGFQIHDGEGESLYFRAPADWQGWKWVEARLDDATISQAYMQADKNKKLDLPVRNVNVIWFTKQAGPTSLSIDALVAATQLERDPTRAKLSAQLSGAAHAEPEQPASSQLLITNYAATPVTAQVEYSLQRNPSLYEGTPPHPVHGTDHALGTTDWVEHAGKKIGRENTLTDNDDHSSSELPWGTKAREAFQYLDLGQVRNITHMSYVAGDANWAFNLDIAASTDGKTYAPVAGLQNLDWQKKWGYQEIKVPQPFTARYLRFRHHKNGEESSTFRMPISFSVFDGVADEEWQMPQVGEVLSQGILSQQIPAGSFESVPLKGDKPLMTGAYLLSVRMKAGDQTQLLNRAYFVMPPKMKADKSSRFGLNTSTIAYAPLHERLGIGWVRFENMKWRMISRAPGEYTYLGLAPWMVPHDRVVETYQKHNMNVLPFLFETPDYASSAPADMKRKSIWPPKEPSQYGDFVFQTIARYGSKKHPPEFLKTVDKKSGLGWIDTYELWNEPNLINKDWGAWATTLDEYYTTVMRPGAEAARRADPTARITNGGFAGIKLEIVDTLRSFKYPDGKMPLDFMDILNVHFYTGRMRPELSTQDPNVDRSGRPPAETDRTLEDHLTSLGDWRDKNKPGMPIWLTETGYDTAGPYGIGERNQAARLPRVLMLALGHGVEKVIIYREAGAHPGQHAASGIMHDDTNLKPSWFSYATLIRELEGTTGGERLPYPDRNVRLFAFPRAGGMVLSAWAVEGEAKLNLKLGNATVTDSFGARRRGSANEQALSEFPIYIRDFSDMNAVTGLREQARRDEVQRKAELVRQEKLRAYLFDFGSTEHVGTLELGAVRRFTPVLAAEVYNDQAGYGFFPKAAGQTFDQHWVRGALNRDGVRIGRDSRFQFLAVPGRYRLRAGFTRPGTMALSGATVVGQADNKLEIKGDEPVLDGVVVVGDEPVALESGHADIRWVTLVEESATSGN